MGAETDIARAIHDACDRKDHTLTSHLPAALKALTLARRHITVVTITSCAQHMGQVEDLQRRLDAALKEVGNLHRRLDAADRARLKLLLEARS